MKIKSVSPFPSYSRPFFHFMHPSFSKIFLQNQLRFSLPSPVPTGELSRFLNLLSAPLGTYYLALGHTLMH